MTPSVSSTAHPRIRKVVIPAAGLGRRFLPATKVVPKEMLPVAGRPLIQLAVEEAVASGVETIILVIGKGKELLKEHFQRDAPLEKLFRQHGHNDAADLIHGLAQLAEIRTAWQKAPLGLADAIYSARSLVEDEPFAVLLPDAVIDAEQACLGQLMACYAKHYGCIIATRLVRHDEVERFGIMDLVATPDQCCGGRASRVRSLTERPRRGSTNSRYGIFGRYILEPGIFDAIERTRPGFAGELQLTDALLTASSSMPIYAYRFTGEHFDCGSKLGFLQANLAFALKDAGIAPSLKKYLARLNTKSDPAPQLADRSA
jgi:UTP--glucose-1-phosphate uridylyltransferase